VTADAAAFTAGGSVFLVTATTAGLLAAARFFVDGGPGATLALLGGHAALLVTLSDVLGLAFLLIGVRRLIALRHEAPTFHQANAWALSVRDETQSVCHIESFEARHLHFLERHRRVVQ